MRLFLLIVSIIYINTFAQYNPGTYKDSLFTRSFNEYSGKIVAEVTLSEHSIEKIDLIIFDQDTTHKNYGEGALTAKDSIPEMVLTSQSIEVDAVSGATLSSNAIILAVARVLERAYGANYKPGVYSSSAFGRIENSYTGEIEVELKLNELKIQNIKVRKIDQDTEHKRFGYYTVKALENLPDSILEHQSIRVDGVSQATNTSNAIVLAVARALNKARMIND